MSLKEIAKRGEQAKKLVYKYKRDFISRGIDFVSFIKDCFKFLNNKDIDSEVNIIDTIYKELKHTPLEELEQKFERELARDDIKRKCKLYIESIRLQLEKERANIKNIESLISQGATLEEVKELCGDILTKTGYAKDIAKDGAKEIEEMSTAFGIATAKANFEKRITEEHKENPELAKRIIDYADRILVEKGIT